MSPAHDQGLRAYAHINEMGHARTPVELGTLEAGKLADLIVADGNPLEDLSALRDVELVMKDGEVVISPE